MIGGQVADVELEGTPLSMEQILLDVYKRQKLFLTATKAKKKAVKKVYAKVNTKHDPLTIRKSASSTAAVLGRVPKKSKVEVLKKGSTWTKIKYKNTTGYVATRYLKF